MAETASTLTDEVTDEVVLRRRFRIWPVDALVVVVVYALVAASISLQEAPEIADRINLCLGIAVLVVGLALAWRRPTVTLRPSGLTARGQTVAWPDITGIYDVRGLRSRYVRIFVASQQQYWRLPALTTSCIWPGVGYVRNLAELNRFATAHTDEGIQARAVRRAPSWLYPAFAVAVVVAAVAVNDPVDYWLPRYAVTGVSTTCDVDLTGGLTTDGMTVDSPMLTGTSACRRRGPGDVVVEQVLLFKRSAVVNGSGVAHAVFDTCSFSPPDSPFEHPAQPGPLPADEVSASGYRAGSGSGVYLIARKANAIVFVGYASSTTGGVAAWPCDAHKNVGGLFGQIHFGRQMDAGGTTVATASPADLALVTRVAEKILDGLS